MRGGGGGWWVGGSAEGSPSIRDQKARSQNTWSGAAGAAAYGGSTTTSSHWSTASTASRPASADPLPPPTHSSSSPALLSDRVPPLPPPHPPIPFRRVPRSPKRDLMRPHHLSLAAILLLHYVTIMIRSFALHYTVPSAGGANPLGTCQSSLKGIPIILTMNFPTLHHVTHFFWASRPHSFPHSCQSHLTIPIPSPYPLPPPPYPLSLIPYPLSPPLIPTDPSASRQFDRDLRIMMKYII